MAKSRTRIASRKPTELKQMATQSRWHYLYATSRWRKRARYQLRVQPLCAMCLEEGRLMAASVADHIQPHHGDQLKFFLGELQSLCRLHHDSAKKRDEARGYSTRIGADGWPTDPKHPIYTGTASSSAPRGGMEFFR